MSTMPTGEGSTIAPATDTEEQRIRDDIDRIVVADGAASYAGRLHIGDGDGQPVCGSYTDRKLNETSWKQKEPGVFPPGFRPLCRYCVHLWRGSP